MKIVKNISVLLLFFVFSAVSLAQPPATMLNKNRNDKANGLAQALNKLGDTLFLKSDKDILRINFLSHVTKEKLQIDVGAPNVNIPLYHFAKGRYTIAVYREDKIIAFDINRIRDILMPDGASEDLEESLLEASLSDKEKVKRGMIPPAKNKEEIVAETKPTARELRKKALEQKKKELAEATKKPSEREKKREALANRTKRQTSVMTYNLSRGSSDTIVKQSRAEYRKNNLRPNGKPYD